MPLTGSACQAGAVGQAGLGPDVVLSWPSGQSRFQDSWLDRERGNSHSGDRDTNLVSHTVGDSTTLGSEGDTTDRLQAGRGTGCHYSHGDAVQRHRVLGDRKEVREAWEPSGGGPFTAPPNGQQVTESSKNNPRHMGTMGTEETGA